MQSDNRFCSGMNVTLHESIDRTCGLPVPEDSFWWMTAAANHALASSQGYELLLYCIQSCIHPDSGERRAPQWCKLIAIKHALSLARFDMVLYMDTDAFWKDPKVSIQDGLVSPYAPELLRSAQHERDRAPAVYFGCNTPWDYCGIRWNYFAPNAESGSAGTGLILLRNEPRTANLLHSWWHARHGWARPQHFRKVGTCSDQAVLWRMWSGRHDLARTMQIFGRPRTNITTNVSGALPRAAAARPRMGKRVKPPRPPRSRSCMRVAGTKRTQFYSGSPITHLASNVPSYRTSGFRMMWAAKQGSHDARWCVTRIALHARPAAARLFGHVDATLTTRTWFTSVDVASPRPAEGGHAVGAMAPQVCAKGVLHDYADVCCDASCGPVCGGAGCRERSGERPGGARRCCAPDILRRDSVCKLPSDVGCKLPWLIKKQT